MNAILASTSKHIFTGQRIRVRGLVQGVGFRPMIWRLAHHYQLVGQVLNDGEGVLIEAFGESAQLDAFIAQIPQQSPPLARIDGIEHTLLNATRPSGFHIVQSQAGDVLTGVVADAGTCPACIKDIFDPTNRRYLYPFTNCTHCGPRLSILSAIPYDRQHTSMAVFPLCKTCQTEYQDPRDRRFHAQPNACADCGPKVWLDPIPEQIRGRDDIEKAAQLLKQGHIIAIKGLGGFHLACDATQEQAVQRLRARKHRYVKPFALMSQQLETIRLHCQVSSAEETLLRSPAAPIVLLPKLSTSRLAKSVAPNQSVFGFMMPYTPLHHLLMESLSFPLVMTSGNISDAPQTISNSHALAQLQGIADFWLLHDRDIRNRIDDSVVRILGQKNRVLRRARGYAPTSLALPKGFERSPELLAFGGELKNTFCLIKNGQAIISQHMGDLENASVYDDYLHHLSLYQQLYQHQPRLYAADLHPEYLSSKYACEQAEKQAIPLIKVQHHHAHIAACLAENLWPREGGKVLGVALDGLGFGEDGSLWGGEFLLADYQSYQRLGHLKPIPMIGSQQAVYQPWRNTYAHLTSAFNWSNLLDAYPQLALFTYLQTKPLKTLEAMLAKQLNTPLASSCGRLFDAVAAAIGICSDQVQYEGQAAIELEALVSDQSLRDEQDHAYDFDIQRENNRLILDAKPLWKSLLNDLSNGVSNDRIASRFHLGLSHAIVNMVQDLNDMSADFNTQTVALSGGVFQNSRLFSLVSEQLSASGFQVLSHSLIPANDGGLALGQAVIALAQHVFKEDKTPCV